MRSIVTLPDKLKTGAAFSYVGITTLTPATIHMSGAVTILITQVAFFINSHVGYQFLITCNLKYGIDINCRPRSESYIS